MTRRFRFDLDELKRRIHILEGYAKVFDALDEVIRIIRKSEGKADAARQADEALRARRGAGRRHPRAQALPPGAARDPHRSRRSSPRSARRPSASRALSKSDAKRWARRQGRARRRSSSSTATSAGPRSASRPTSRSSSRTPSSSTRTPTSSSRATAGSSACASSRTPRRRVRARATRSRDVLAGNTKSTVAFFTNFGSAYVAKIVDIPASTGYGDPVQKLFKFDDGERVVSALLDGSARSGRAEENLDRRVQGRLRRCASRSRRTPRSSTRAGRRFAKVAEGDEIVGVRPAPDDGILVVATSDSHALVCDVAEVNVLANSGRAASRSSRPSDGVDVIGFAGQRRRSASRARRARRQRSSRSRRSACRAAPRGGRSSRARSASRASCRRHRRCRSCADADGGEVVRPRTNGRAQVHRAGHRGPRGARAGAQAPRHVHRRHRLARLPPPALGDRRQLDRRGHQRLRQDHLGHARQGRQAASPSRTTAAASPSTTIPKYKKTALELILCTLHAGGKFEQGNYIHSGGLHGVGSSVVNALSEELTATVWRDGAEHVQSFARGKPTSKLKEAKKKHHTGTRIYFRPDPEIFGAKLKFDAAEVRDRLEAKTYLHRGLHVIFEDEATGEKLDVHARRRHRRLPASRSPPSAARRRSIPTSSHMTKDEPRARDRAAVDRGHRRARPLLRQRHPDRLAAARTRPASSPASSRRCATSSRRTA